MSEGATPIALLHVTAAYLVEGAFRAGWNEPRRGRRAMASQSSTPSRCQEMSDYAFKRSSFVRFMVEKLGEARRTLSLPPHPSSGNPPSPLLTPFRFTSLSPPGILGHSIPKSAVAANVSVP